MDYALLLQMTADRSAQKGMSPTVKLDWLQLGLERVQKVDKWSSVKFVSSHAPLRTWEHSK
eukprot:6213218-Pleurochrysis_carterae.AAC.3